VQVEAEDLVVWCDVDAEVVAALALAPLMMLARWCVGIGVVIIEVTSV
jgi:hypothetical protein